MNFNFLHSISTFRIVKTMLKCLIARRQIEPKSACALITLPHYKIQHRILYLFQKYKSEIRLAVIKLLFCRSKVSVKSIREILLPLPDLGKFAYLPLILENISCLFQYRGRDGRQVSI